MQQALQNFSRPHWPRWLLATLSAWLSAPLASPFMWRFLIVEGIDIQAILVVGFWTYFIGLPIADIGIALLLASTLIWYQSLAAWTWWQWAALGALSGLAIMIAVMRPNLEGLPQNEAGILLLTNGPVAGMVAVLVFRRILFNISTVDTK